MFQTDMLADQHILITGGGTGLGRGMALRYAELGAKVSIVGRREEPLKTTVADMKAKGAEAAWTSCDVRDPKGVKAAMDTLEGELGPVTALVNNAAGNFVWPTEDLSYNAFNAVVQIVLYGTFNCTTEMGRRWIDRKSGGTILSIIATYAYEGGTPFVMSSAAAKAGVTSMMRTLAVEWGEYDIRTASIAPGAFPTQGASSRLSVPAGGKSTDHQRPIPLKRVGEHIELSNLTAYLLSPMAAYISGDTITIDGAAHLKSGASFGGLIDRPREEAKQVMREMRERTTGKKS